MLKKYADILIILSIILVFPLAYYENIEFLRIFLMATSKSPSSGWVVELK